MTSQNHRISFCSTGALLEGTLSSGPGLHSRQFFQCAQALGRMPIVERFRSLTCGTIQGTAEAVTVISPAMGGLCNRAGVARQLGLRFIFAERRKANLVLEEVSNSNLGSAASWWRTSSLGAVESSPHGNCPTTGAIVVGVAMLVDRSDGTLNLGVPTCSLIRLNVETFPANHLPRFGENPGDQSRAASSGGILPQNTRPLGPMKMERLRSKSHNSPGPSSLHRHLRPLTGLNLLV